MFNFYDHQAAAFEAVQNNDKGIIVLPTGTGKTRIQAGIITHNILQNPKFGVYVVSAPRIILSLQLLKNVFEFVVQNGINARYMAVHSGKVDKDDLSKFRAFNSNFSHTAIPETTSPEVVKETIAKAKKEDRPLIIFSTYHSIKRVGDGCSDEEIDIMLSDEGHYLTQKEFNKNFFAINPKKKFFFTATPKITRTDDGRGMNNVEAYGEIIYKMNPAQAIEKGRIVRPRLDFVKAPSGGVMERNELDANLGRLVMDSFNQHNSVLGEEVKGKLLIAASGVRDMEVLIDSQELKGFMDKGGLLFAVASDKRVKNYINGKRVSRTQFLKELQTAGSDREQELIVIHYDILTEGIDVPGLTGVLFLRDQTQSKFTQTYGRVARLDPQDRANLDSGLITSLDTDKMVKPYAWIIIPVMMEEDKDKEINMSNLTRNLRSIDFKPAEMVEIVERGRNSEEEEEDEIVDGYNPIVRFKGEIIEHYRHDVESERIANMNFNDVHQESSKKQNIPRFSIKNLVKKIIK